MDSGHLFFGASSHGNMLQLGSRDAILGGSRCFLSIEETSKKRPFFTTSEELIEEEYYDDQSPEKKRRLTAEQVHLLEKSFETENKLEPERKTQLAKKLGLQPRQVAVWFQNRRARWKTKQLERDYGLLKASFDSLRTDYDTIAKENEKLKSEVVSLKEKMQGKEVLHQTSDPPGTLEGNVDDESVQFGVKLEDGLSCRSGGSDVLDEENFHRVDSVDSYFPGSDYSNHIGQVDGLQSEEDDIGDDNPCYFSEVFAAAADHHHPDGTGTTGSGWWVWS